MKKNINQQILVMREIRIHEKTLTVGIAAVIIKNY